MTIAQLYNKLKTKEISKSNFLSEVRKALPQWVTSLMSFDDTIRVLKNKNVITESYAQSNVAKSVLDQILSSGKKVSFIKLINWVDKINLDDEDIMRILYRLAEARKLIAADGVTPVEVTDVDTLINRIPGPTPGDDDDNIDIRNSFIGLNEYGEESKTDFPDATTYIQKIKGLGGVTGDELFNELPDDMPQAEVAQILYKLIDLNLLLDDDGSPISREEVDNMLQNTSGIDVLANKASNPASLNESQLADKDRVSPYEFMAGMRCEMEKGKKPQSAENIVLRNLAKDPIYYTNQLAGVSRRKKRRDIPQEVTKDNLIDKSNASKKIGGDSIKDDRGAKKETFTPKGKIKHLTQKAKRAKGVKRTMTMPGKEKKVRLKEGFTSNIVEIVRNFLKDNYPYGTGFEVSPHKGDPDKCDLKWNYWEEIPSGITNHLRSIVDVEKTEVEPNMWGYTCTIKHSSNLEEKKNKLPNLYGVRKLKQIKSTVKKMVREMIDGVNFGGNEANLEPSQFLKTYISDINKIGWVSDYSAWRELNSELEIDQALGGMYVLAKLGLLYDDEKLQDDGQLGLEHEFPEDSARMSPEEVDAKVNTYQGSGQGRAGEERNLDNVSLNEDGEQDDYDDYYNDDNYLDRDEESSDYENQINQPDYQFYVFDPNQNKIIGGFEYRDDAIDMGKERTANGFTGLKVYSKKFLVKTHLNPDDNNNWGTDILKEDNISSTDKYGFTVGESYTAYADIGKFKKGEELVCKDVKLLENDVEVTLENLSGIIDQIYLDPDDTIRK
jgi:hypothetical protein